jgi:16S rRNA (cytosine967-C5)-methyltransferase
VVAEATVEEVPAKAKATKKTAVKKEPKPKVAKAPKDDSAAEPKVSKVKASTAKTKAAKA